MSFYQYYANREKYRALLREAEKERLIRRIQQANRERSQLEREQSIRSKSSWIQKINWAIKEARENFAS